MGISQKRPENMRPPKVMATALEDKTSSARKTAK